MGSTGTNGLSHHSGNIGGCDRQCATPVTSSSSVERLAGAAVGAASAGAFAAAAHVVSLHVLTGMGVSGRQRRSTKQEALERVEVQRHISWLAELPLG